MPPPHDGLSLERHAELMESIAERFPSGSDEHRALKRSALCVLFVHMTGQIGAFGDFLERIDQPLAEHELAFLRSIDIDPDAPDP